jgi:hypothetical protein
VARAGGWEASGASRRKGLNQGEFSDLSHTFGLREDRGSGETDV